MAIAIDQANAGEFASDTSGSTIAVTTTAAVASGGFIVAFVTWVSGGSPTLSSVSGGGLTWAIDKQASGIAGVNIGAAIVSAQAPSGLASGTTITASLSGSTAGGRSIGITSFTGVATSAALDTTSGPTTSPSAAHAWSTASTTIAAGSVLIGMAVDFNSFDSSTPTSPSIEAHDFGGGGTSFSQTDCYRIESSASSYTVAGTWSGSTFTGGVLAAAYKAAAGGTTYTKAGFGKENG